MGIAKLDPKLEAEIEQAEAVGATDRTIPVLIEHKEAPVPAGGITEDEQLRDLEQRVSELQQGIMSHLVELGAEDRAQQLALANVISAQLTPREVRELAKLKDVRAIRLNRQQNVTT
jgi:hypothetical protein